jgi:hypothetical protein
LGRYWPCNLWTWTAGLLHGFVLVIRWLCIMQVPVHHVAVIVLTMGSVIQSPSAGINCIIHGTCTACFVSCWLSARVCGSASGLNVCRMVSVVVGAVVAVVGSCRCCGCWCC